MKVAVFSDIHSNYLVFEKAYNDALERGVGFFLFLGDYVTDGEDANKVLDIIKSTKGHVINGNREVLLMDYHINKSPDWDTYMQYWNLKHGYQVLTDENIEYLAALPFYKEITINDKKILMAHSTPYSPKGLMLADNYEMFDKILDEYDCDLYLFGHTHKSYDIVYRNKRLINVGSIGLPTDGLPFKYGILTIDGDIEYEPIGIDYDYAKLEKHYINSGYYQEVTIWCKTLLEVFRIGYDEPQDLIDYMMNICKERGIDSSKGAPNEIFIEASENYKKAKENIDE